MQQSFYGILETIVLPKRPIQVICETWGNLNVSLTATGEGGSSTITKTLILLPPNPIVDFNVSLNNAFVGQQVSFTSFTSYATDFNWNFGDGSSSTEEHPTHIYTENGTYTVTLSVTGVGGTAHKSKQIDVSIHDPVALFEMNPNFSLADDIITFSNQSQYASAFEWDFGDGQLSTDQSPTHAYSSVGVYSVTLKAINLNNVSNEISKKVFINGTNGFGETFENLDNWELNNCNASIINQQLHIAPTTTTKMGIAVHTFPRSVSNPWEFHVDMALKELEDNSSNSIMIPLNSDDIPAMMFTLVPRGDSRNWGLIYYLKSENSWIVWDNTCAGKSNAVNEGVNEFNHIQINVDAQKRISFRCNDKILRDLNTSINAMEDHFGIEIKLQMIDFGLNSQIWNTIWDNVYFESTQETARVKPKVKVKNNLSMIEEFIDAGNIKIFKKNP